MELLIILLTPRKINIKITAFKKAMKMYLKIFSVVFVVFCFCGFWYQVTDMSAKYFKYAVATKTALELPDLYILHDLDLCFNYRSLISAEIKLTLKNIMEKTPEPHELIQSCRHKKPNSYRIDNHSKIDCLAVFNVTKYVVHRDICYSISYLNRSHEFYYEAISNGVDDSRAVFMIVLPESSVLRRATTVRPVIHGHDMGYPYLSMTLATGFWFERNSADNSFWSDYFMYKTFFLPSPYETQCRDYGQNTCIHKCLTELSLKEFGEIPYSLMTNSPHEHVQVNLSDPFKDMMSRKFYMQCTKQTCSSSSCSFHYVSTFSFKFHSSTHNSTSFSVSSLSSPDTFVRSVPLLYFNEYVIFIMSCSGSWLGVSILGMNPIAWYRKRYQQRNLVSADIQTCPSVTMMMHMRKDMFKIDNQTKILSRKIQSMDRMCRSILENSDIRE